MSRSGTSRIIALGLLALAGLVFVSFAFSARFADEGEVERIRNGLRLTAGDTVADVGAGNGRWTTHLSRLVGNEGRVFATEVDERDLDRIRQRVKDDRLSNVTVIRGNQTDTGLAADCCDGILLRRVYHHFSDPEAMQASLAAALRPGGRLLIVELETQPSWSRPKGIPRSRSGHGIEKELLVEEMRAAGFEVAEELRWERGDYAIVFRRPASQ